MGGEGRARKAAPGWRWLAGGWAGTPKEAPGSRLTELASKAAKARATAAGSSEGVEKRPCVMASPLSPAPEGTGGTAVDQRPAAGRMRV